MLPRNLSESGFVDGDSLLLKNGATHQLGWASGDGVTINRTVTIAGYGPGGRAKLVGAFTGSGVVSLLRVFSSACVIDGIEIAAALGKWHGIYVGSGLHDFTLTRCRISGIHADTSGMQNGLTVGAASGINGTLCVRGCEFDGIGNDAIMATCADRIVVEDNDIRNVSVDTANGDCVAVSRNCASLEVRRNRLDHSNKDSKQCIIQDGGTSGNAVIEDNILDGYFGDDSTVHTGIYLSLPGVIRRNRIRTWRSGIYLAGADVDVIDNTIIQGAHGYPAIYGAGRGLRDGNVIVRVSAENKYDKLLIGSVTY